MADYKEEDIREFLIQANSDVGCGKYKGDEMTPDYCKAILIAQQLQRQLAEEKKRNGTH